MLAAVAVVCRAVGSGMVEAFLLRFVSRGSDVGSVVGVVEGKRRAGWEGASCVSWEARRMG